MGALVRRVWLGGLGGLAATHVLGCASTGRASVGRTHATEPPPVATTEGPSTTSPPSAEEGVPSPVRAPENEELPLPPRAEDAETGTAFLARAEGLGRGKMDEAVVQAILSGNIPHYLRRWSSLAFEVEGHRVKVEVTNDYLAVGSDNDFVRMPMTAAAAQRIADELDASLPTRRLVDLIYANAEARLPPSYIDGGPTEGTLRDYAEHHEKLEKRRIARGFPLGVLTAGHKKDIVLSERLIEHPESVCIYGWHIREGEVIQSLSTRHSRRYADYSHGVRLVAERVELDGRARRFSELLVEPEIAHLLCDEGPLSITAYPTTLPEYVASKKASPRPSRKARPSPNSSLRENRR